MNCRLCNREYTCDRNRTRCNSCNTKIRRVRNKIGAIQFLGGKCNGCNTKADLSNLAIFVFHHKDPTKKEFAIAGVANKGWEVVKKELEKCELLCANCHQQEHSDRTNEDILNEAFNYKGTNKELSELVNKMGR